MLTAYSFFSSCSNPPDDTNNHTVVNNTPTLPPAPKFNEDSTYSFVKVQVDFGPRVNNTDAHKKCGDWMVSEFKKFGASVIDVCYDFLQVIEGEEQISICMGNNNNIFQTFEQMEIYMPPSYSFTMAIQSIDNTTNSEFSAGYYWGEKV